VRAGSDFIELFRKLGYSELKSDQRKGRGFVFAGDLEGNAFALDAKSGEKLWSFNTGAKIAAPPVSFAINGRQYIAISTGGGSIVERQVPDLYPEAKGHLPADASTLFVFALPSK